MKPAIHFLAATDIPFTQHRGSLLTQLKHLSGLVPCAVDCVGQHQQCLFYRPLGSATELGIW